MVKKFIEFLSFPEEEANVIAFGVPLGKGANDSLSSIREVSDFVDVFDVERKVNMLEKVKVSDAGDIEINELTDITNFVKKIIKKKRFPLIFGKSHLLSLYTLQAFPTNVKIVVFDAHGDIKDDYLDELSNESLEPLKFDDDFASRYNYTTWLRRASEIIGPRNIAMIGLRDCDEDDFKFISDNKILYFSPKQIKTDIEKVKGRLKKFVKGSDIYMSLDIDVFDPSIAPAVDNPEPNGLLFSEFLELIDVIAKGNVVGLDLVEIKPLQDKITEFLAVEAIFQTLSRVIK